MKIIQFSKPAGIYFPGDIAGFDDDAAKEFIDAGAARPYTAPAEAAVEAPVAPAVETEKVVTRGGK